MYDKRFTKSYAASPAAGMEPDGSPCAWILQRPKAASRPARL